MKGIILAGGTGSRLMPITTAVSKQLLPVYDKPLIYYPLSLLMLAGIKDVLIITNPGFVDSFKQLFGTGKQLGMNFSYKAQKEPRGLADAFIVGKEFIGNDSVCLVLGDNIIQGSGLSVLLKKASAQESGATIFGYKIANPVDYGVVEVNEYGKAISIEEKPKFPKSDFAVPGLYFYDNDVIEIAKNVKPSPRGEIEITDVNIAYMKEEKLNVSKLGRGIAWFDTGTATRLLSASEYVQVIQETQGVQIACLEEIAYNNGWITIDELIERNEKVAKCNSEYYAYIRNCVFKK